MHYGELHTLSRFHSYKHMWVSDNNVFPNISFHNIIFIYRTCNIVLRSKNISSLRHPDGASNPNLQSETLREPGNGAEESKDKKSQGSDEGDMDEVPYPPPLQSELLSLSRDGWVSFGHLGVKG